MRTHIIEKKPLVDLTATAANPASVMKIAHALSRVLMAFQSNFGPIGEGGCTRGSA